MRTVEGGEVVARLRSSRVVVVARAVKAPPEAHKDIDEVVRIREGAHLSSPVARLKAIGVMKG